MHSYSNKYFFIFLGTPAIDVLRRGLSELTAMCEHMLATFEVGPKQKNNYHVHYWI